MKTHKDLDIWKRSLDLVTDIHRGSLRTQFSPEKWTEKRIRKAKIYDELVKNCNEIKTPKVLPYVKHVYHLYVIRVENRDKIQQKLKEQGIATGIHYPIPLYLQPAYKYLGYKENDFPITEKVSKEILSLPIYPELSVELQKWIIENLRSLSEDERKK